MKNLFSRPLLTIFSLLVSFDAVASPAQNAAIAEDVKRSGACIGVTVGTTCFGDAGCDEAIRLKKVALTDFKAAGVAVEAIYNPWKMVLRQVDNAMVLQPYYGRRGQTARVEKPSVTYYDRLSLTCANAIALAISIAANEGQHGHVPALVPVYLSSLSAQPKYINFTWANPEQLSPNQRDGRTR